MPSCRAAVIIGGTVYPCLVHLEDGTHLFGLTGNDCPEPWCRSPRNHLGGHDVPTGLAVVCERPAGPDDPPYLRVRDGSGREWRVLGEAAREPERVSSGG